MLDITHQRKKEGIVLSRSHDEKKESIHSLAASCHSTQKLITIMTTTLSSKFTSAGIVET